MLTMKIAKRKSRNIRFGIQQQVYFDPETLAKLDRLVAFYSTEHAKSDRCKVIRGLIRQEAHKLETPA